MSKGCVGMHFKLTRVDTAFLEIAGPRFEQDTELRPQCDIRGARCKAQVSCSHPQYVVSGICSHTLICVTQTWLCATAFPSSAQAGSAYNYVSNCRTSIKPLSHAIEVTLQSEQ